jgi:hypothetical protein
VIVRSRSHGRKRAYFYACGSYHERGKSVCSNHVEDSMAAVDRAVLGAFEQQLLGSGMVDQILDAAVARMPGASAETQQDKTALTEALNRVETEIRNLTAAVAAGGELSALVKGLKEREAEAERLRRQLVNAERAEKGRRQRPRACARSLSRSWPSGATCCVDSR